MGFRSTPYPIGDYTLIAGTAKRDRLTAYGAEAVFGGPNNDTLTGYSQTTLDGNWRIIPLLSGGLGNDTYFVRTGTWNVIADLNGGKDTIRTEMSLQNIYFAVINGRDILATDGSTTTLLIDPLGIENPGNRLEVFYLNKKRYTANKLYDLAINSSHYMGALTYTDLQDQGVLNLGLVGMDPLRINDYINAARWNNDLVT